MPAEGGSGGALRYAGPRVSGHLKKGTRRLWDGYTLEMHADVSTGWSFMWGLALIAWQAQGSFAVTDPLHTTVSHSRAMPLPVPCFPVPGDVGTCELPLKVRLFSANVTWLQFWGMYDFHPHWTQIFHNRIPCMVPGRVSRAGAVR